MARGRSGHFAVPLKDDSMLVGGGYAAGTLAERFVPGPAATPVPTPTATPTATPPPAMAVAASASPKRPTLATFLSRLPKHLTVSKKGTITFRLRCSGPGACLDHLELRLRSGEVLGRTRLRIPHGRPATIRLRLSKAAVRKLGRESTKVTLTLTSRHISVKATAARAR
jgi:hypothetical protein